MNVVVEIEGRKALPVWTIPYATGRNPCPDRLITMLSQPESAEGIYSKFPGAFNVDKEGKPNLIPSEQWLVLTHQIKELDADLSCKNLSNLEYQQQWFQCSIELIRPYRAYIWLSEFHLWFNQSRLHNPIPEDKPELCLNPLLPFDDEGYFEQSELNRPSYQAQSDEDGWLELVPPFIGEPVHEDDSLPFYVAYEVLESRLANLSNIEFGLFVFNDDIRIFEKRPDKDGFLARLSGGGILTQVGKFEALSKESTPFESTFTRFRYAKADIERLSPQYRYIPFDSACKEIAAFVGKDKNQINLLLVDLAKRENIWPHHPYCGLARPEDAHLWPQSAFPDYKVDKILSDEFGISLFGIAWKEEVYLSDSNNQKIKPEERKRFKELFKKTARGNLLIRLNAIAEMAAILPESCSKHHKLASDLLKNLEVMPARPHIEERVKRFVWLNILEKRKSVVDAAKPSEERTFELEQLNKTIVEIKRQLGCLEVEQEVRKCVSEPIAENEGDNSKGRRDEQVNLICDTAQNLGYPDLLNIPGGGKKAIKVECLKITQWFTEDGFKKAWVEAGKRNLIRIKDKQKYL